MPRRKKKSSEETIAPTTATKGAMSPQEYYKKLKKEDKEKIVGLQSREPILSIPTGSWVINSLIGDGTMTGKPGGCPRGHIMEVFGDESSGKTTFGLSACRQVQLQGGLPIWLDFEYAFHDQYAENLGLDLDPNKFVRVRPDNFEEGAKHINNSLLMKPSLIVVDSVSAMIPKAVLEGAVDEGSRIGLQAQLMSQFLAYISKKLRGSGTCLLFLNQLRSVIKGQYERGPKEESSGGKALKFYASVRLKFEKGAVQTVDGRSAITGGKEKKPVNLTVRVKVVKNRIDKPYKSGPVYIRFGEGFDNYQSIAELALTAKVVKKSGAMYTFSKGDEEIFKVNGKEKLRELLAQEGREYQELRSSLVFQEDEEVKQEAMLEEGEDELDAAFSKTSESFQESIKQKKAVAAAEGEEENINDDFNEDDLS